MTQGFFITFEGGDGVGKSTQVRLLADFLRTEYGLDVITTREPGGTELGQKIRQMILHEGEIDSRTEALLYAADRAYHVAHLIRPALNAGKVVISDRYFDSSIAYQSGGRQLEEDSIRDLSLWATRGLIPDLTFLLDVPETVALKRLSGHPDRLESAGFDFHRRTRQSFHDLAKKDPQRWHMVDTSAECAQVSGEIAMVAHRFMKTQGFFK